jgi:hypothetical protein
MLYVWSTILILLNAVWLAMVVFGLPGNWLIVITTYLFAWWRWEDKVFSIYTLIAIAGLGEFFGITSKFALGVVIWLIVTVAAFWP